MLFSTVVLLLTQSLQDNRTVERLGLHCPTEALQAVLEDAAATAETRKGIVAAKDGRDLKRDRQLLLERFPQIPSTVADQILEHGFLKGSGRVGRSAKLDADLKFEIAVTAHIRHNFTNYDA